MRKPPRRLFRTQRPPQLRDLWESATDEEKAPYLEQVEGDLADQAAGRAGCAFGGPDGMPAGPELSRGRRSCCCGWRDSPTTRAMTW